MIKKLLIIFLLCLPSVGFTATDVHYVTQGGAGSKDGSSSGNAFEVTDFNSSGNWDVDVADDNKIGPGDTVYFSGTITSQLVPPQEYGGSCGDTPVECKTSANYVTLDGWEGGTCDPVANLGCASAVVVDRPSRTNSTSNWGISSIGNSYLIIQDFNIQDSFAGIYASGPETGGDSTHLTIRRNYIHNMEGSGAHMSSRYGTRGIAYLTFGGANGDGNYVYDTMEASKTEYTDYHNVGFTDTDDLVVSYNFIDNSFQDLGDATNVLSIHYTERFLVEYNTIGNPSGQSCLAKKETGGDDGIIRFNKFYGCGQQGVGPVTNQGPQTDYYIYGNLIFNSSGGIWCYRNYERIHIWSNVIHNIFEEPGRSQGGLGIDISSGNESSEWGQGYVYVYNNTVSRGDMDGDRNPATAGIVIKNISDGNVHIKNNIAYYNNSNYNDNQVYIDTAGDVLSFDYNTIYSGGTEYVYYNGSQRTASYMNTAYGVSGNEAVNPGFTDPAGTDSTHGTIDDDYTLSGTTTAGGDLSGSIGTVTVQGKTYCSSGCDDNTLSYDYGLDPGGTNWSTTPPTVAVISRDENQWDRGAYVYVESEPHSGVSIN